MNIEEIQGHIQDLVSVEPKSLASPSQAKEAAAWVSLQKQAEAEVEAYCNPSIKAAFDNHKQLVAKGKDCWNISKRQRRECAITSRTGSPQGTP